MKRVNIDWQYIKKSAVIAGVCLTVSIVLLGSSLAFNLNAKTLYKQQKDVRDAMQDEGRVLKDDIRLAVTYSRPFAALVKKGVVGEERRLNWVEALREISAVLQLSKSNYRIEPKKMVSPDYIDNSGSFSLYASKMNLQLSLLHEADLLSVISALDRKAFGIFHVESCEFERKQEDFLSSGTSDNLSAECQLAWYTLDDTSANNGEEQ